MSVFFALFGATLHSPAIGTVVMLLPLTAAIHPRRCDHYIFSGLAVWHQDLHLIFEEAGEGVDFVDADPWRQIGLSTV